MNSQLVASSTSQIIFDNSNLLVTHTFNISDEFSGTTTYFVTQHFVHVCKGYTLFFFYFLFFLDFLFRFSFLDFLVVFIYHSVRPPFLLVCNHLLPDQISYQLQGLCNADHSLANVKVFELRKEYVLFGYILSQYALRKQLVF